ncbi:MAG TPA: lysine--tRNA ligase [Candidatus Paceibacterota bacterium]
MSSFEEIRDERVKKLKTLEGQGINPFPISTERDYSINEVKKNFSKLAKRKKPLTIVGRTLSLREHGGSVFLDIFDSSQIQAYLKRDKVGDGAFKLFMGTVDVGDFLELRGNLFLTRRGEQTLNVSFWKIIAKSLRPLPEKWHGLQDIEERFRKRYLDLLMNKEVRDRFAARSQIIKEIRVFFDRHGYIEVETPILQTLPGGATAEPFVTHHNALNQNFYLRIAQELYLKKLLVGGLERVYEIGRIFRNEGIDTTHNPEFTMLESQEAYADAKSQMEFIEDLMKYIVKKIFGKTKIIRGGETIDFSKKFSVIPFLEFLKRHALIPKPETATKKELSDKAAQLGIKVYEGDAPEKIMDNIYKKICRPKLVQPTFIIDYPVAFNPFAKRKEDNPTLIDRFQLVVGGIEIVNAFSELNNPVDQKERYLEQDKKREGGEHEISPSDEDYLEAMEYGMPPNGGIGIGIDRLVMFLTDTKNIKEVILFPTLKPKS